MITVHLLLWNKPGLCFFSEDDGHVMTTDHVLHMSSLEMHPKDLRSSQPSIFGEHYLNSPGKNFLHGVISLMGKLGGTCL